MTDSMPPDQAQPRGLSLDRALGFSKEDLDANRGGRMSDSQRDHLRRLARRTLVWVIAGMVFNGAAATLLITLGTTSDSPVLTVIGMGLTVVNAVIVGVGGANLMRTQRDLRVGEVAALEGTLRHTIRMNRRNRTYVIDIAGEHLIVPHDLFAAFEESAAYRLYRSPATKILFTAEKRRGN